MAIIHNGVDPKLKLSQMNCYEWCFLVTFLCLGFNQLVLIGTYEKDSWIDPNAWSREIFLQNFCKKGMSELQKYEPTDTGEAVALMYYKRLIAYLFKSDLFVPDEATGDLSRAFVLSALPEQIQQLKILNDPRDLDSILSGIFLKVRVQTPDDCSSLYGDNARRARMGFFALIWDIIEDSGILSKFWKHFIDIIAVLGQFLKMPEVRFLLGAAFLLVLGRYYQRKYRIGVITMIIVSVVGFGYFYTYLECNRKLEAERTLEMLSRSGLKPTWYSPILNFFNSKEHETKKSLEDFIKKSSQLNLNFCRPDHVFLLYTNDIVLTQLNFIVKKYLDIILSFEGLPAPLSYLAPILLMIFSAYIINLTFKYILCPLEGKAPQQGTDEGRVLGEKLKMFFKAIRDSATLYEIAINNTTATASLTPQSPGLESGVQDIIAPSENDSADSASDSSSEVWCEVTEEKCL